MKSFRTKEEVINTIISEENILIVQDLDGVCIPLVQDPLKRRLNEEYVNAVAKLREKFSVLTCGEHEGRRGVNRLVEKALASKTKAKENGLYLPGLAACGVEFQDRFGNSSHPGLKDKEINFLAKVPKMMKSMLTKELQIFLPNLSNEERTKLIDVAICDTRFTPTLNFNEIFTYVKADFEKVKDLQLTMEKIMNNILKESNNYGLENSFYLHMMPNLGLKEGTEIMKYATKNEFGTTDIQFIINGAIKEAGLLLLLNKYISNKTGTYPFGKNFNVRDAPKTLKELVNLCRDEIPIDQMPMLIGVGDTVTSSKDTKNNVWQRGGSDRGFLTLIQRLGESYKKTNQVIFVNSCNDQVLRPRISGSDMRGISDPNDDLKFNMVINDGPEEYIEWFKKLARNF
ncbi:glucosylglycerol 3-phosphatase [Prochlorococcus marinus]|uniref:Glucosylglycerol 3-phosphatase n=1 Tax=Prochlorococcus marinus XMU1408 TaxID=2213228 RepID=A0A318R5J2_PROMR|nr:glucosylglycerol 3-phosphatase [Prochlorococcus marinus]MBW3041668.1 glucosylglycerol 3-phosphatase [Prochlorococcus marinus str. XMU1408]PYE02821.1 glucosylglycerol 3-phosphatase [Prochlorococcus marinus XMU1408]